MHHSIECIGYRSVSAIVTARKPFQTLVLIYCMSRDVFRSGYIAAWTCQLLLERGFTVRGTVRSKEKGDYLSKVFYKFGDKWSYVIVEDVEKVCRFYALCSHRFFEWVYILYHT